MSELEKLIKEKCPNGVKYVTIGECCTIVKGKQLNKNILKENGKYPVINGGIAPSGYWDEYNFDENLITISQGGASAGYVNYIKSKFWAGAHCYVIENVKEGINYKYVYHFMKMNEKYLQSSQVGAGIPSVSLNEINSLKIPLPPHEIQNEVVRILDEFTLLEEELTAELTARQQQYEYYRNKLFDF